jgi:hypothetical protein
MQYVILDGSWCRNNIHNYIIVTAKDSTKTTDKMCVGYRDQTVAPDQCPFSGYNGFTVVRQKSVTSWEYTVMYLELWDVMSATYSQMIWETTMCVH